MMSQMFWRGNLFRASVSLTALVLASKLALGAEDQTSAAPADKAAAAAATPSATVADVVVTAEKRSQDVQEVPASVTAIGSDKIENFQVHIANDVTNFVPNFTADPSTGHANPRWYLRGIGNSVPGNGQTNPIGIYFDEVYMGIPAAQGFPLFDLERVEVLSGPQGTLWGKNTIAGAVNFISKKPDFIFGGYAKEEFGSYGNKLFEAAVNTPINERVAVRLSGQYSGNEGYAHNALDGSPIAKNVDGALRAQALVNVTDNLTALLNFHYRNYNNTGSELFASKGPTDVSGRPVSTDPFNPSSLGPTYLKLSQVGGSLNLKWDLGYLNFTSISAIDDYDTRSANGTNVYHAGQQTYSSLYGREMSQEFRLSSPDTDRFNWILGGYLSYQRLVSDSVTAQLPNNIGLRPSYINTYFLQTDKSYAVFGNATYNVTDRFKVTGGVRESWETKAIGLNAWGTGTPAGAINYIDTTSWWLEGAVTGAGLATQATQNASKSWNALTYDITPQYALTDHLHAYFRYATGFRSGGFNPGVTTQSQVSVIDPETLTAYEVGLKSDWLDGRLTANVAGFYNDYKNIQVTVIQLPLSQLRNAGAGWSDGAEFSLRALPIENLAVTGTLGFLDTRYTNFPNCTPAIASCAGNQFVRAPHVTANADLQYTYPLDWGGSIIAATNWSFRTHEFFNAGTQSGVLQQGNVLLGNAEISLETTQKVKMTFFVHNLTDARYESTVIPSASTGYTAFFIEPRVFGLRLTEQF